MNSENVVKHLRALWRTDRIIADIRLRHLLIGLGLRAFAALIAAFGLAACWNCRRISRWSSCWSAISAAAILGVVNFAIAAILFVDRRAAAARARTRTRRPKSTARRSEGLQLEARALQSQMSGMVHHPLNGVLPLLIVPLITIIIKSLKSRQPRAGRRANRSRG